MRTSISSPAFRHFLRFVRGTDEAEFMGSFTKKAPRKFWLVVSTPLKNNSQLGVLFPIYGKITNVPNHQPDGNIINFPVEKRMFFGPASDSRTTNETRSPTFRFMGTWQGLTTQNTFFGARPSSQDRISIAFDDFPFRRLPGLVNLRLRSELERSTIFSG